MDVLIKRILKTLVFAVMMCLASTANADDYILYWQVDSSAKIDDVLLNDYVSAYAQQNFNFDLEGYSGRIAGARAIAIVDTNPVVLTLMDYDNDNGSWTQSEYGNEVYIRGDDDYTIVGTGHGMYSQLTNISDPTQLSFAIELGNWEDGNWVTMATSEHASYTSLASDLDGSRHILVLGTHTLHNFQPWNPRAYAVPEPSTALLTMIGLGLIGLMRKRKRRVI